MITLDKITQVVSGNRTLFEDVSITFNEGKRYGLTGPNGAGKSTLMKIIMKQIEPTSGNVTLPARVGFLKQSLEEFKDTRVLDTVIMGNERLWEAMVERDSLYEGEMSDEVGMRLGDLEEIIVEEDGYSAESEAAIILSGMHVDEEYHEETMGTIPTDIQFRVLLCQAIFGDPSALLLDEPTNHLDLESIGWLEEFLHNYKGVLVVTSHDRHFLNAVTTDIADIDYETIIQYPGNYDQMVVTKSSMRSHAEHEIKSKEKKIAKLKEFVAKFGAGTRASQVQSRVREIDRLKGPDLKKSNIQRPYIRFPRSEKAPGKVLYEVRKLSKNYEDLKVFENLKFQIMAGDKIGVIGNNGAGKTTFLKLLMEEIEPTSGSIVRGHHLIPGYFPQNHEDAVDKSQDINLNDWLTDQRLGAYAEDIRAALGKMLFGGDDAFKQIAHLSGGETARLMLSGLMLSEHNTLILDEPNNHLDLEAVCALAEGLAEYEGSVIVASHDRSLIGRVANRIIAFEEEGVQVYDGTLEEYLAAKAT